MCQVIEEDVDSVDGTRGLVTVFDLNQWYHSQMPIFAKWTSVETARLITCNTTH